MPKRDYKKALLTDMKSQIECIWSWYDLWIKPFAANLSWSGGELGRSTNTVAFGWAVGPT